MPFRGYGVATQGHVGAFLCHFGAILWLYWTMSSHLGVNLGHMGTSSGCLGPFLGGILAHLEPSCVEKPIMDDIFTFVSFFLSSGNASCIAFYKHFGGPR